MQGIESIQQTDSQRPPKLAISATSDPSWDVVIQSTWPYFIKGVSESWLMLVGNLAQAQIEQLTQDQAQGLPNFETLLVAYKAVSTQVEGLWREQGAHAYLHHLNAVFGYAQTVVTQRRLMRF